MSVLKKTKTRALPELPPPAEQHPEWVAHSAKIVRVCEGAESIRAEIRALEGTRLTASAKADEDAIAEVLGEALLAPSVARRDVERIDGELASAKQRLHVQTEALRRLEARSEEIRQRIAGERREAVAATHVALMEHLAEQFVAIVPVVKRHQELVNQNAWTGGIPGDAIGWSELDLSNQDSKLARWLTSAKALGVDVSPLTP